MRRSAAAASSTLRRRDAGQHFKGTSFSRSRLLACDRAASSEVPSAGVVRVGAPPGCASEGSSPFRSRCWRATGCCLRELHRGVFDGSLRAFLAPAIGFCVGLVSIIAASSTLMGISGVPRPHDRLVCSEDVIVRRLHLLRRLAGPRLRKHHCGVFDADGDPWVSSPFAIGDLLQTVAGRRDSPGREPDGGSRPVATCRTAW